MIVFGSLMLYFGRVGSLWGLCAKIGSSWGEKVITPNKNLKKINFKKNEGGVARALATPILLFGHPQDHGGGFFFLMGHGTKPNRSDLKAHSYPSNLLKYHNSKWRDCCFRIMCQFLKGANVDFC